jgi:transcriptional antiterminator RfaH
VAKIAEKVSKSMTDQATGMIPKQEDWYVVYTLPRNEKKIFAWLLRHQIRAYLPLLRTRKQWSDRKKWVEEPLFKSYVFIGKEYFLKNEISSIPGAIYLLKFENKPAILSFQEVENIRIAIDFPDNLAVSNQSFQKGQKIKIISGRLSGLEGYITQLKGKSRVFITFDHLNATLSIEVDAGLIEEVKEL